MATRTLTATFNEADGTAWASAAVTVKLVRPRPLVVGTTVYPRYEIALTTDASGQISTTVVTPADGDGAATYRVTYPDGFARDVDIAYGAAAVDLSAL